MSRPPHDDPAATTAALAAEVMRRCDELGRVSDEHGCLTRTFHSPAMQRANALVGGWMREAGLAVREDAAFNLLGRLDSTRPRARALLLGSHLDTVRNAGQYDGPLGVLVALAAVQWLRQNAIALPYPVEIAGFSDEEGVRYQSTYLGSRALAGTLRKADLRLIEEKDIEKARRRRGEFFAYVETHIEQGPVLEEENLPVGVVTAIAGQSRVRVAFTGRAGHAGTTPMPLRRDALCAAAELTLAVENCGVTATVGQLTVEPGASNVIPGRAVLTLDIRDARDTKRLAAVTRLRRQAEAIANRRGLGLEWAPVQETASVRCDASLSTRLGRCVAAAGLPVRKLPSGAGHDAAAIAVICPVAMLFVRCRDGLSHHPDESVLEADVATAIRVLAGFLRSLGTDA